MSWKAFCRSNVPASKRRPLSLPALQKAEPLFAGGPLDYTDHRGMSLLHHAVLMQGPENVVMPLALRLTNAHVQPVAPDGRGRTPLHLLLSRADEYAADVTMGWLALLASMCDVNAQDCDGVTALHYACDAWNAPAVKFLLDRGASLGMRDAAGVSPLGAIMQQHHS